MKTGKKQTLKEACEPHPILKDYTDEEIYAEIKRRKISAKESEYKMWHTKISEKGVKISDLFVVKYKPYKSDKRSYFGLATKKQWKREKFLTDNWDKYSDWADLLPDGFSEAVENGNEFDGTDEEAVALLKKCGFEVIEYSWGD